MAVPLVVKGTPVAALAVFSFKGRVTFEQRHLDLLAAAGAGAATALENARLHEETRQAASEARMLLSTARALSSGLRVDEVLEVVARNAARVSTAGASIISLVNNDDIFYACGYQIPEDWAVRFRLKMGESLTGRAAKSGKPVIEVDMGSNKRISFRDELTGAGMRSALCVPMKLRGKVIGVLSAYAPAVGHFGQREVDLLTMFASHAAIALENAQVYEELGYRQAVQVELLRKVIRSEEDERNRLAGAIHDDLLQTVIAALYHVRAVEEGSTNADEAERVGKAGALLEDTVEQARRLIFELRPPLLEDLGLVPALRKLLDRLARDTRVETSFKAGRIPKLDQAVETALYRVVQESLANIKKHAHASRVSMSVRRHGNKVEVAVRDNGEGFDKLRPRNALSPHYGLALMRERAVLSGGLLDLDSTPGKGTRVRVVVPVTVAAESAGGNADIA